MSAQSVESILSRAMSDAKFANALFANPEQALAGFDLTTEETAGLKEMTRADFDVFAKASPEERKSFSVLGGSVSEAMKNFGNALNSAARKG